MAFRINLEDRDMSKPISLFAVDSSFEVLAEAIETPFLDYAGESESGKEPTESFVEIDEAERINIRLKPEFDVSSRRPIRLHLPREAEREISVETGNGRIKLKGLKGHLNVDSKNGPVRLEEVNGTITVTCANGSVEGENLEARLDVSTSNGRITIRESKLEEGSIKSGNGRISLQVTPVGDGNLSVFSGSGRVRLALPEEGDFRITVQTKGKLYNHLDNYSVQTEQDATVLEKGTGAFAIMIQNFAGGVSLVKYDDFDRRETGRGFEFCLDFEPEDFVRSIFSRFDPAEFGHRWKDFAEEIPKVMGKMSRFGSRFGRMGEEVSRQFHESSRGRDEEIKVILDMLRDGKISAEEAERLINAVKGTQKA
jgi:hypothetical protein